MIFQIAPLAWVAINSLQSEAGWGMDNFSKVFASKFYLQALQRSLEISFWSSLFGIVIATLGAYSLRQVDSKLRDFVSAFANMTSNFAGVPLAASRAAKSAFSSSGVIESSESAMAAQVKPCSFYAFRRLSQLGRRPQ